MRLSAWFGPLLLAALLGRMPAGLAAEPPAPAASASDLKIPIPRVVRAGTDALGLGRQRLALVIANPRMGDTTLLPAAPRDAQAVAAALRALGWLVIPRDDLTAAETRAELKRFRDRLAPDAAGLIYIAAPGVQVDGENLVLARDTILKPGQAPQAVAAAVIAGGVPWSELVQSLQVTPSSLRLLVVDGAHLPPALSGLAEPGLARPTLPSGVMALLSAAPGAVLTTQLPPPLPRPVPTDPRALPGSAFGTGLVYAMLSARVTGPDALRLARRNVIDGTGGNQNPWIGGRSDEADELGSPQFMDALLPQSPQEAVVAAVRQAAGLALADRLSAQAATGPAPTPPVAGRPGVDAGSASLPASALPTAAVTVGAAAAQAATLPTAVQAAVQAAADIGRQVIAAAAAPPTRQGQLDEVRQTDAQTTPGVAPAAAASPAPARPPARPAAPYVPKVNPNGYAEGDTYTYRRIDAWKDELIGVLVMAVSQVLPNGEMVANDGQQTLDAQGRRKSDSRPDGLSRFEPSEQFWWSGPKRGESRDVEFTEFFDRPDGRGEVRWDGAMAVGRPTRIELPGGSFDVLPIEGDGWFLEIRRPGGERRSGKWERVVWYAPRLGHPVAIDIVERDAFSRLVRRERIELEHVQVHRLDAK
jgi:hypothetical protein